MSAEQELILQRVIKALNKRYNRVNGDLCSAVDVLERLGRKVRVGEPVNRDIDATLSLLINAIIDSTDLQNSVIEMVHDQLAQAELSKEAYAQGWDARLVDLLARATPEEAVIIHALLVEEDTETPF